MRKKIINGCSYSNILVYPKNWETTTAKKSLQDDWYIKCRFYDPKHRKQYPNGFQFTRRVNEYDTVESRREAIKQLLIHIPRLFEKRGFNPITGKYMTLIKETALSLSPNTDFIDALRFSITLKKSTEKHKKQLKWCLKCVEKSANELMVNLPISEISRKHIKTILDNADLTAYTYNKFKSYLSTMFQELIEIEVIDINPCQTIKKIPIPQKIRDTLTLQEFELIQNHLQEESPEFYRFMMIFLFSGSRISELLNLQKKDIDLGNQEYIITINKGNYPKTVKKVILSQALPFWNGILSLCKSENDYLFTKNLAPSSEKINPAQITRRWNRHIKKKLGITADFYSLKHTFLDSLPPETAKKMAAHTNLKTTRIYQVNQEKRDREELKKIRTNFTDEEVVYSELIDGINWN